MGKHLDYIKKLNDLTSSFTAITNELWQLGKNLRDEEFKTILCKMVAEYSNLNYKFISVLISKTIEYMKKDVILKEKIEFDEIVDKLREELENGEKA